MNAPLPAPQEVTPSSVPKRLQDLRAAMKRQGWSCVHIPSSDPHLSEYLPEHWQGRAWASGFSGSMGNLGVLHMEAALFADSRYWVQAEAELQGSGIDLVKSVSSTAPSTLEWLAQRLAPGSVLAVDGRALSMAAHASMKAILGPVGISVHTDADPLAEVWSGRPALPTAPIQEHPAPFASVSRTDKLTLLRTRMAEARASHHLISSLDDLAWTLNLRGSDVSYNPVFLGHALLSSKEVQLFVDPRKLDAALLAKLADDGVTVRAYEDWGACLAQIPSGSKVLLDPQRTTVATRQALPKQVEVVEALNPSTRLKSVKSSSDAQAWRETMARDGAAMCAFYAWFESALGRETITELTVDERLSAERLRQPHCSGPSFATIAGFNANGALPHYRATTASHATISTSTGLAAEGLLLIDSGGQYLGGTTDITRVWPIGTPSRAMCVDVTLVLKAMIALSVLRFPTGTPGPMIDAIARAPLWQHGLDYGHGTGHGVGYALNVHEGPQSISKTLPTMTMSMVEGMVTSNEPGLYRAGQWGVRIENLVLTVPSPPAAQAMRETFGEFLSFETLTLCPIDTRCLLVEMLRDDELQWLNQYHATVRERLTPFTQGAAYQWLMSRTETLSR